MIDNAHIHKKEIIEPIAERSNIPVIALSPYSPFFH